MRNLAILVLVAGVAWAGGNSKTVQIVQAHGVPPTGLVQGLKLSGAEYVQCSVHGVDSLFTSGSVCWYRNPNEVAGSTASTFIGDAGWEPIGNARQTASFVQDPDGGAVGRFAFPAKKVAMQAGRIVCIGCNLNGTANDGGTAIFNVRTEVWGPSYTAGP